MFDLIRLDPKYKMQVYHTRSRRSLETSAVTEAMAGQAETTEISNISSFVGRYRQMKRFYPVYDWSLFHYSQRYEFFNPTGISLLD